MAYEGWLEFGGVELVNVSRTVQLARTLGISSVVINPASVSWIEDVFATFGYGEGGAFGEGVFGEPGGLGPNGFDDITEAPWYDPGYPASAEFAGFVPLRFDGLDDSTLTAAPTEYITDGGNPGMPRNAMLTMVASFVIVAQTDRGAEFGKRWLDRVLRGTSTRVFCAGSDLRYFRYAQAEAPVVHRRNVRTTRGTSVTKKRRTRCGALWMTTFTMTAGDPFEYGEQVPMLADLGGTVTGDQVLSSGSLALVQEDCPVYDYSPIYDPLYPALVPSPTAPNFLPDGWGITTGETFDRFWARVSPVESSFLNVVPIFTLTTTVEARMVRVSIWPSESDTDDQCGPLFSAVLMYLPPDVDFYIDGEQSASYTWDGFSPSVRRADSLVFSPEADPVQWAAFNDHENLLVTLDIFSDSGGTEGDGEVRAALAFVPKSD